MYSNGAGHGYKVMERTRNCRSNLNNSTENVIRSVLRHLNLYLYAKLKPLAFAALEIICSQACF